MIKASLRSLTFYVFLWSSDAFQPQLVSSLQSPRSGIESTSVRKQSSSSSDTTSFSSNSIQSSGHNVEVVRGGEDDPRVLDVASFRNGVKNPEMMVKRAKEKRDAVDNTAAAIDGLKIGFLYVGPLIGGFTFLETQDVQEAIQNYAVLGGGLGVLLAGNNYMGRSVHVPDIPEATNRIIVDFSEGLLRQQDVGFVAVNDGTDPFFNPAGGVMGAVDIQLRNSDKSHPGVRKVSGFPPHLHIKNMEVHPSMRNKGVGLAMLNRIVEYATMETDGEALTLEVEAANPAAVNLYRKFGFQERDNPNKLSKNLFMFKKI